MSTADPPPAVTRTRRAAVSGVVHNGPLLRVVAAWALFVVSEYGAWTAVLVYAFTRGGTSEAAAASIAQLVPAAVLAPLLATFADRRSPSLLLTAGLATQGAGLVVGAAAMLAGGPAWFVYGGVVVASTAVATTRPAMSLVVPALSLGADELPAANAVIGWVENASVIVAGLVTGVVVATGRPGGVLVVAAAAVGGALLLTSTLRVPGLAEPNTVNASCNGADGGDGAPCNSAGSDGALRVLRCSGPARTVVALVTTGWVVVGALDVLFVVLAVQVLRVGPAWAGYLNTAFGVGGTLAALCTLALLGRRLGPPLVAAVAVLAGALAATATVPGVVATVALVVVVGAARSVVEVVGTTLLQRTVPGEVVGRIFGVVEGLSMAAMALGALLVPVIAGWGGATAALLGVAAVGPVVLVACAPALAHLDDHRREPLVELSLLRQVPLLAGRPTSELEPLARAATRVEVAAGREVPARDRRVLAVASGVADELVGGRLVATRTRGDTLGAPAPGTSVVARTALVLYAFELSPDPERAVAPEQERDLHLGAVPRDVVTGPRVPDLAGRDR